MNTFAAFNAIFLLSVGFAAGLVVARIYQLLNEMASQSDDWRHEHWIHKNSASWKNELAQMLRAYVNMKEAMSAIEIAHQIALKINDPDYDPEKPIDRQK